ncbi:hypothetical protein [Sinorhizobium fredii]|uniref:hypothetical protein n=1 Tax=Rhizobium fredii TaxID=380 RepID=UPI0033990DC1
MPDPAGEVAAAQAAEATKAADATREIMFKWVDVVIDQSNDLWTLNFSILTATVLVGLHLYSREESESGSLGPTPIWLKRLLWFSFGCCLLSLMLAYKLKGTVISTLQDGLKAGTFTITSSAAIDAIGQATLLLLGAAAFVCAVGLHPRWVMKSLFDVISGRG